ncbi:Transcription factor Skn-1-like DNA-binding domain-containing protein [Dioscorea alata]|uniref:Transcription factor Skn-1-like DNA-binding domain-containing protein n=1 Tax=Dioscorea alata TaxID=55571 RepID=A0ACB7WN69_DIOAL|nr:Transcription factor Skn-1-like DNA-binding domain-containing protein [Dioscorea alata]
MEAKEQPKKSFFLAFLLLFITISTLSFFFFYNYSFLLETLYITINDSISRKAMFLFCNVILLILAIDSGLFRSSVSSISLYDELLIRKEESRKPEADVIEKKLILDSPMHDNDEEVVLLVKEEEVYDKEEDEEKSNEGMELVVVDDQIEKLEVEELNKRIEEFIEKVKQRRRLEDMQLIKV